MRVALVDPSLFTLPYDAALAAGLQAEGHDVVLHGRRPGHDDNDADSVPLRQSFYRMAATPWVGRLPSAVRLAVKGVDHLWSMRGLLSHLREQRPDVIHFQWLPLPVVDRQFLGALRRVAPLVLTVHDTNPFNGNPTGRLQRVGAHAAFRNFDRLIVHTAQGRARLIAHGETADRVVLMPHGLLGRPTPVMKPDSMLGDITFLLFGKIKPYKGVDLLIEAFARMPTVSRQQAKLWIVGKPYMDIEPLREMASRLLVADRVKWDTRFVGDDEVEAFFRPGVVATFPYREIEASGVLSLAISHGRPLLAARLGGFTEAVTDGRHGVLVPPENVDALSDAMTRFVVDRPFAAGCAAAVQTLTGTVPSWQDIARRTIELYRALPDKGGLRSASQRVP